MAGNCDLCGKKFGFGEIEYTLTVDSKKNRICIDCVEEKRRLDNIIMTAQSEEQAKIAKNYFCRKFSHTPNIQRIADVIEERALEKKRENPQQPQQTQQSAPKEQDYTKWVRMKYALENREEAFVQVQSYRANQYKGIVYCIEGARGRTIDVYPHKCVIHTGLSVGSVIAGNATDGTKTIYYQDVLGLQFKKPGVLIGYIQLETASGLGNNIKDNFFNENTFTFDVLTPEIEEMYDYLRWRLDETKKKLLGM